jgi:hypothetical protein
VKTQVFQKVVADDIIGTERWEIPEDCRMLHGEAFYNQHSSPNIMTRWAGTCSKRFPTQYVEFGILKTMPTGQGLLNCGFHLDISRWRQRST